MEFKAGSWATVGASAYLPRRGGRSNARRCRTILEGQSPPASEASTPRSPRAVVVYRDEVTDEQAGRSERPDHGPAQLDMGRRSGSSGSAI